MIRCFFTDVLPKKQNSDYFPIQEIQEELEKALHAYKALRTEFQSSVENGIITLENPRDIKIYDRSLLDLIKNINDIDIRRYAFLIFSKYPIEYHIDDSRYTDMLSQDKNVTLGQEQYPTFILPVAKQERGYVFSVPFCTESKKVSSWEGIPLLHDSTFVDTRNWLIDRISEQLDNFIERIKLQLLKYNLSIKYPSSFEHSIQSLSEDEQITIMTQIINCAQRGYLERPDHNLVKVEDGSIWAIRNRDPVMRIYFECEERVLYIASLYKGHEDRQINEHLRRAPELIRSLKTL